MSINNALATYEDMDRAAGAVAETFKMTKPNVIALFLLAQSEGVHPMTALRRYHIIEGKPAMRADAMQAGFQEDGGTIDWQEYSSERAAAIFAHPKHCPNGKLVELTMKEARDRGLTDVWDRDSKQWKMKANWRNHGPAMLRARVISAGVRMVHPGIVSGYYTPEEIEDIDAATARQAEVLGTNTEPDRHAAARAAAGEHAPTNPPQVTEPAKPAEEQKAPPAPSSNASTSPSAPAPGAGAGAVTREVVKSGTKSAPAKQTTLPVTKAPAAVGEIKPLPIEEGREPTIAHLTNACQRLVAAIGKDAATKLMAELNVRFQCACQNNRPVMSLCPTQNIRPYIEEVEEEILRTQQQGAAS